MVGQLEKIGLPLDWALNIPSLIGFALLMVAIYTLAKAFYGQREIAIVSVILFLFNGSFSFWEFFKQNKFEPGILKNIIASFRRQAVA